METQECHAVKIGVSADGMKATAVKVANDVAFTVDDLRSALEQVGVTTGLQERRFEDVGVAVGKEVIVAEGIPAVPGKKGWVELLVPVSVNKNDDDSQAGVRQYLHVRNARKGDSVARVHPPEKGTEGRTVTGKPLPAHPGAPAEVHMGSGVAHSPNDPALLVAKHDGNAILKPDGTVDVEESILIAKDLDYSIGDVDFVGSLVVRGDIHSDLVVKVGKNLEVSGDIGDSRVEAGGDVTVRKGFLGRGSGSITAGGSVSVQHILNQTVKAAVNIAIQRESVNGKVYAGKSILAPMAAVMGGELEAEEILEVKTIGRAEGSQAKVRVGHRGKIVDRLNAIEKELHQGEKNLTELKDAVFKLVRMKIDAGVLAPEKEALLKRLQDTQKQLPQAMEALKEEKASLNAALAKIVDAKLIVHENIFEYVFIEINGARKMTDAPMSGVAFIERNGEIIASGL